MILAAGAERGAHMETWELNEKKKEYLNGYRDAEKREKRILEEIQQLRLDTMFQSLQNDGMPRGSNQGDLSDYMARHDDLMRELIHEKTQAISKKQEIRRAINKLKKEEEIDILIRKYILKQTWETIAEEIGCSRNTVFRMHGRALENFEIPENGTV